MLDKAQTRPDLLLVLSLLLVILMYPVLDQGDVRRLILGGLMFAPVLLATVRLSQIRALVWPSVLLIAGTFIVSATSTFFPHPALIGTKWGLLTVFFGLTFHGLFSVLLHQECPHRDEFASLHRGQHLPNAGHPMVLSLQRH